MRVFDPESGVMEELSTGDVLVKIFQILNIVNASKIIKFNLFPLSYCDQISQIQFKTGI